MPNVIRLGDPTDHGGAVTQVADTTYKVDGIPVARVGDLCSCPKRGHNNCTIAEGDPEHTVNGIPVAYEGHHTSCGAVLQSTIGTYTKT